MANGEVFTPESASVCREMTAVSGNRCNKNCMPTKEC